MTRAAMAKKCARFCQSIPLHVDQPQIGLVDQGRGLQRVPGALADGYAGAPARRSSSWTSGTSSSKAAPGRRHPKPGATPWRLAASGIVPIRVGSAMPATLCDESPPVQVFARRSRLLDRRPELLFGE